MDALVLVDIQNDYFPRGAMELVQMEQAAGNAAAVLEIFRKESRPVYHIQHIAMDEAAGFFLPDTPGARIHEAVAPLATEPVITKHFPNSFRETDLLERLQGQGAQRVVICGAMSHMCIDATTRAAFDHGLECTVVEDACATRDLVFKDRQIPASDVHSSFMAALSQAYARVVALSEFRQNL